METLFNQLLIKNGEKTMKKLISSILLMVALSIPLIASDTPGGNRSGGGDPCPTCSTASGGNSGNSANTSNNVLDTVVAFLNSLLP